MYHVEFRLNAFKEIGRWLDGKFPGPLAFFLKGWLYGLEDRWIAAKAAAAVEQAIAPYTPEEPVVEPPSHHTEPSEVEGLDTISYSYEFTRTREEDEG